MHCSVRDNIILCLRLKDDQLKKWCVVVFRHGYGHWDYRDHYEHYGYYDHDYYRGQHARQGTAEKITSAKEKVCLEKNVMCVTLVMQMQVIGVHMSPGEQTTTMTEHTGRSIQQDQTLRSTGEGGELCIKTHVQQLT